MNKNKIIKAAVASAILVGGFGPLAACSNSADVASHNLSKEADNFQILRRIVFYNGITGQYVLTITGLCSVGNDNTPKQMSVTCKTGPGKYKKDYLGLSDNVTWFAEQINSHPVSTAHYEVVFKPSTIVPDIKVQ